jgi:hypothetical protein
MFDIDAPAKCFTPFRYGVKPWKLRVFRHTAGVAERGLITRRETMISLVAVRALINRDRIDVREIDGDRLFLARRRELERLDDMLETAKSFFIFFARLGNAERREAEFDDLARPVQFGAHGDSPEV